MPPVEVTAPFKPSHSSSVPPASTTALMVCAVPPRLRVPPVSIVIALAALNELSTTLNRVAPLLTVVAPV